jgi:hypothetical protein
MIAFDLQCANGHVFEGWFEDGKSYEKQKKQGMISCPVCDEVSVSRIPSTFAIQSSTTSGNGGRFAQMEKISNQIYDFVEKNFDDVGSRFATEALKMHYGVTEPRNIRGVSTKQEEETLSEEGIEFFKVPLPPTGKSNS